MAQQPNVGQLGGFAQPEFVLINSSFWNNNEKRRYVQGQAWITEFTDVLLDWIRRTVPNPTLFNAYTNSYEPLEEKGSLEILKYAFAYPQIFTLTPKQQACFRWYAGAIRDLRNKMTHDVRRWTIDPLEDTLIKLLENMKNAFL